MNRVRATAMGAEFQHANSNFRPRRVRANSVQRVSRKVRRAQQPGKQKAVDLHRNKGRGTHTMGGGDSKAKEAHTHHTNVNRAKYHAAQGVFCVVVTPTHHLLNDRPCFILASAVPFAPAQWIGSHQYIGVHPPPAMIAMSVASWWVTAIATVTAIAIAIPADAVSQCTSPQPPRVTCAATD